MLKHFPARLLPAGALAAIVATGCTSVPSHPGPAYPGVPAGGAAVATDGAQTGGRRHSEADVRFMQGMLVHHAQALELTALVPQRTNRPDVRLLAERMDVSQRDEIALMRRWLVARGTQVPSLDAGHHRHDAAHGLLTPEEITRLAAATGAEFDRLFLQFMIRHHEGALTMVAELFASQGAAQSAEIFRFATDVDADQRAEMERMRGMLVSAAAATAEQAPRAAAHDDPRVGLRAGLHDAATAMHNLAFVAHRPRPAGFYNEADPADFNYANSDLAFRGDYLFQGNYHGFQIWDVANPASPALRRAFVCPGGQGDVSIHGNLLFVSAQETRSRLDCGTEGVSDTVSGERIRGVRIFDVSDLTAPRQVAAVQTCRGSHTHTLVPDPRDTSIVYVYVSGTNAPRPEAELRGCVSDTLAVDTSTAYFRIEIVRVPLAAPHEARIVSMPRIFADPATGTIAGLWPGGEHGPGMQSTTRTDRCHDITAYPEFGLAAGACSGNGILLDIRDPVNPVRIHEVSDPNFAYWHSATFSNDARKVIFTDEWGGGSAARCRASDRPEWGANALFELTGGRLRHVSYYKLPAPQSDAENCVAHNGSLIPVPGRDIMVQSWYQGGISVFDFTDLHNPIEIAYFDRGPAGADTVTGAGHWSAYWYNGRIYGSEILRGLDVLRLVPGVHLSSNEILAAELVRMEEFNPQTQTRFTWAPSFVVVRAYLDQVMRNPRTTSTWAASVTRDIEAARRMTGTRQRTAVTRLATRLEREARRSPEPDRLRAMAEILREIGRGSSEPR